MQKPFYRWFLLGLLFVLFVLMLLGQKKIETSSESTPLAVSVPEEASNTGVKHPSDLKTTENKSAYTLWNESKNLEQELAQRFYKVDMQGQLLDDKAAHWVCVYDASTGLLWEVKTNDGGWQDHEHTYSWYQPPGQNTALHTVSVTEQDEEPLLEWGVKDGGHCYDIACDTYHYATAVNNDGLCASANWRLPYAHELGFLDHTVNYRPDIDTRYFPYTAVAAYWSRTETPKASTLAWAVDFSNGFPYVTEKRLNYHIRLVSDALWIEEQLHAQR